MQKDNLFEPGKVRLYSGKYVNVASLTEDDICLEDIAHSLAMTCRFNGNTKSFFSVLSHSILVSSIVENRFQLEALMHDAHEAYLFDIPSPYKKLPQFKELVELENSIQVMIDKKYGLFDKDKYSYDNVKSADMIALNIEWNSCVINDLLASDTNIENIKKNFFILFINAWNDRYGVDRSQYPNVEKELKAICNKYSISSKRYSFI